MNCTACKRELVSRLDVFGELDEPLCWNCYSALMAESEIEWAEHLEGLRPIECPECHKLAFYNKTEAGYPGLYHCAACGIWIDQIQQKAWTWRG